MRIAKFMFFLLLFGCLSSLLCAVDVTGKWTAQSENGPSWVFNLKSDGCKVTGTIAGR